MLKHVTDLPLYKENAHVFSYPGLAHWHPVQGQLPRTLARPITHYERPALQSMARHVMGYSQLLSIKTIRAAPCRDVPRRAGRS